MNVPWTSESGVAIGADWLEAAIAPAAELGRRARRAERAFRPGDEPEARAAIERVVAASRALGGDQVEALRQTIAGAPDPTTLLARASAGDVLADTDFFELQRFLDALADVRARAPLEAGASDPDGSDATGAAASPDVLQYLTLPPPLAELAAVLAPGRTPARTFYLSDEFDPDLVAARNVAAARLATFDRARSALNASAAGALGVDHLRDGEFIVMRELVPAGVPAGIRVVREAPTYLLCELGLDDAALAALRASDEANAVVAECEEAVRIRLSQTVRDAAARIRAAAEALGALDSFLARVRFAQRYEGVVPEIAQSGAPLTLEGARYLPLEALLADSGVAYEPISLTLETVAVVTGPNMGGKSAALRTCGFAAACLSLGVPVPAAGARLPLFAEIAWIGIGRGAEEKTLLSAFGAEIVALRTFLERSSQPALVLIDEFARTTSPHEGRALLVALLEGLRARHDYAFAATHLGDVAQAARVAHYAIAGLRTFATHDGTPLSLERALASIASAMDHRLTVASERATSDSDAIALAEVLGLEPTLVARARELS